MGARARGFAICLLLAGLVGVPEAGAQQAGAQQAGDQQAGARAPAAVDYGLYFFSDPRDDAACAMRPEAGRLVVAEAVTNRP